VILLLVWSLCAHALPTRVATQLELGTQASDVEVSTDGSAIAIGDESSGTVWIVDVGTWSVLDAAPCDNPAGVANDPGADARFWVGCGDGTITGVTVSEGTISIDTDAIDVSDTAVMGLAADSDTVYVLFEDASGGYPQLTTVDVDNGTVNSSGNYPAMLGAEGFEDVALSTSAVFVTHGGSNITRVDMASGGSTLQIQAPGGTATGDILVTGPTSVLVSGGDAGVLSYETGTNRLVLLLGTTGGVESATALASVVNEDYALVADGDQSALLRLAVSDATGFPSGAVLDSVDYPESGAEVTEIGAIDGYAFAGTATGTLWVLTDRPWVEAQAAVPSLALNGDEVSVVFSADQAGTWEARLHAETNTGGTVIDSGTIKADKNSTATFTVGSVFKEGDNRVRLVVENEGGKSGHDIATVNVDNPPSKVQLRDSDTGFGDRMITIDINGISDEDLTHYMVYVSTTSFDPAEYDSGGPDWLGAEGDPGAGGVDVPRKVRVNPGVDREVIISPLTNGVRYYVAIRAYDEAGQEGPMSNVATATPRKTYGAAALAGDKGGFTCSTGSASGLGLLALLGSLLVGMRRAIGVAVLLLAVVTTPAHAAVRSEWPQSGQTLDEIKGGSFELRYGPMFLTDDNLTAVFGESGNNILWMEAGPTFFDILEVTGSIGYFHRTGKLVSASGAKSSQEDNLNAYPLAVDLTARIDVLPEQPLVPFFGVGMDYWLWREKWENNPDVSGEDSVGGGKSGWHYSMGAHILLDVFEPTRAGRIEAVAGITDSFLTVEYRIQKVGENVEGLKFSANTITVGLKLDY
jgi:hypothetical protein